MEISPEEMIRLFKLWQEKGRAPLPQEAKRQKPEKEPARTKEDGYKEVLIALKQDFGTIKEFSFDNAKRLVRKKLGRSNSTTRDALRYGVERGLVYRRRYSVYSFEQPPEQEEYKSPENALADIVCDNITAVRTAFRIIVKLRSYATLFLNKSGVSARFMDSNQVGLLDLQIRKEFFRHYHVSENVKLTVEISDICRVLEPASELHFLLQKGQPEGEGFYQIGDHRLHYKRCIAGEQEFSHSLPMPGGDGGSSDAVIARSTLVDILKNVRAGSNRLSLTLEPDSSLTFASDSDQYSKTLHNDGHDLKITRPVVERVRGIYDANLLMPILSSLGSQVEHVTLTLKAGLLQLAIPLHPDIVMRYLLAPIQKAEVPEP